MLSNVRNVPEIYFKLKEGRGLVIIEKIHDDNKTVIMISGVRADDSQFGVEYLCANWEDLYERYTDRDFAILIGSDYYPQYRQNNFTKQDKSEELIIVKENRYMNDKTNSRILETLSSDEIEILKKKIDELYKCE